MPLTAPPLPLPSSFAIASLHPCTKSLPSSITLKPLYLLSWKHPPPLHLLIRSCLSNHPTFSLASTAVASSSADFRSPASSSPGRLLPEQLFAQESRNQLTQQHGEAAYVSASGKKNVEASWSFLPKVARILAILLLGLGAVFSLHFPALAKPQTGVAGSRIARTVGNPQFTEVISSSWAGLAAGGLHTLTGPDHLAALAPLCIGRARLESALIGALWGCGHDAGQVIFGLAFLLLKDKLHVELVRTWGARVVGVTLLAIGAVGLKEAQEIPVSALAGESGSTAAASVIDGESRKTARLRTFAAGLVYGLQPDALIMILPALALPSRVAGAAYLVMFLVGTVIAMGSYTAFIATCGQALEKRVPSVTRRLTIGSSFVAIAFGIGVLLGEVLGINLF